jgi:hypothetical protein
MVSEADDRQVTPKTNALETIFLFSFEENFLRVSNMSRFFRNNEIYLLFQLQKALDFSASDLVLSNLKLVEVFTFIA